MNFLLDKNTINFFEKKGNIDLKDCYLRCEVMCDHKGYWLEKHKDIESKLSKQDSFNTEKLVKLNKEYSMIFNVPGVYLYQCTPHKGLGMIALVVVGGDTSNKDDIANAKTFGKSKKILPDLINQL